MEKSLQMKDEVLRYLGYKDQKIDRITDGLIKDVMDEIRNLIHQRYIYKFFNISKKRDRLSLIKSNLELIGNDIKNHLDKSEVCVLMAVTLGHEIDTRIRYYEKTSMTKALILDACATTFIEETCDRICIEIERKLEKGKVLTSRYSPGYGDLPIDIQNDFLLTLNAKKTIGLTASSHSILIPRKSVTAIVGVINREDKNENNSCVNCNKYSTCEFSKGGNGCGY